MGVGSWAQYHCNGARLLYTQSIVGFSVIRRCWPWMTSKRDSRCFVLALAPDAPASTRLPCLAYINVPLSTHCKIRYVSKFTVASRGYPCDSTAFLLNYPTQTFWNQLNQSHLIKFYVNPTHWNIQPNLMQLISDTQHDLKPKHLMTNLEHLHCATYRQHLSTIIHVGCHENKAVQTKQYHIRILHNSFML